MYNTARDNRGKIQILKAKKLKNLKEQVVYIDSDSTKEERDIQNKIRNEAKELRKSHAGVIVGYQKIIINGEKWIWSTTAGKLIKSGSEQAKNMIQNQKDPKLKTTHAIQKDTNINNNLIVRKTLQKNMRRD